MKHKYYDSCCTHDHHNDKLYFSLYLVGLFIYLFSLLINPFDIITFNFNELYLLLPIYLTAISLMGIHVIYGSLLSTFKETITTKRFKPNLHILMVLATIGAFIISQFHEGVLLILIFSGAHFLEDLSSNKSSANIEKLLSLTPPNARLIIGDDKVKTVSSNDLKINDLIKVLPGDIIPRDGVIVEGKGEIDESIITGEAIPVLKTIGSDVFGGTINQDGTVIVKINKASSETILAKMVEMVKETKTSYTKTALIIKKIEPVYVTGVMIFSPIFYLLGLYLFDWGHQLSFYRTMVLLIGASPCALAVTDIPATLSALSSLAKSGILFKGGDALSKVSYTDVIAFDKTGTLTVGKPELVSLVYDNKVTEAEKTFYNKIIYSLEYKANHPLARAVMEYFNSESPLDVEVENIIGTGLKTIYNNKEYSLVKPNADLLGSSLKASSEESFSKGYTVVYFKENDQVKAILSFNDMLNDKALMMVNYFKSNNVQTVLITGDSEKAAKLVADKLAIDKYYASVLPEDKHKIITEIQKENNYVMMVGDGINDAVALKSADVGVSMGDGTDIAIEVSDGVLIKNDLEKLTLVHKVSKKLRRVVLQNIFFAVGVILFLFVMNIFGLMEMPLAVIIHEGSTLVVVISGLRLLTKRGL